MLDLRRVNLEIGFFLVHLLLEKIPDPFHHFTKVHGNKLQLQLAALNAAHFQNIIDQVQKMLAGQDNLLQIVMNWS